MSDIDRLKEFVKAKDRRVPIFLAEDMILEITDQLEEQKIPFPQIVIMLCNVIKRVDSHSKNKEE
jgi:hypothetical protein